MKWSEFMQALGLGVTPEGDVTAVPEPAPAPEPEPAPAPEPEPAPAPAVVESVAAAAGNPQPIRIISPHMPPNVAVDVKPPDPHDFDRELNDADVDRYLALPLDLQGEYAAAFRRGMEKTPIVGTADFSKGTGWIDTAPVRYGPGQQSGFRAVKR